MTRRQRNRISAYITKDSLLLRLLLLAVMAVFLPPDGYIRRTPGSANDKMWVFDKKKAYMVPYPRYFQMKNYYNFFDNSWLNKNPLLVKNPYQ